MLLNAYVWNDLGNIEHKAKRNSLKSIRYFASYWIY